MLHSYKLCSSTDDVNVIHKEGLVMQMYIALTGASQCLSALAAVLGAPAVKGIMGTSR